jgi:hypothetical protein
VCGFEEGRGDDEDVLRKLEPEVEPPDSATTLMSPLMVAVENSLTLTVAALPSAGDA